MICKCKSCGESLEWTFGDTTLVCRHCGAARTIEKSDVYEQAGLLAGEDSEESLEQAMLLYRSLRGWQDADQRYMSCRTRLGQTRWREESARLKEEEARFEAKGLRWKRIGRTVLAAALLCIALATTLALIRFRQYNRAAEYYVAGEYARSAAAFLEMGNYKDSKTRVYLSAVGMYNAKQYEEALPYFLWLDGQFDHGYYLRKCQERLAAQEAAAPDPG